MMVELMDVNSNKKVMVLVLFNIKYINDNYVVYSIKRNSEEVNLFASLLVKNSQGYCLDHNFSNGQKNIVDSIVHKLVNKTSLEEFNEMGYEIFKDVNLGDINYFDINECYVTTMPKNLFMDFLEFYDVSKRENLVKPVITIKKSKKKFNEGFVQNVMLIIFGVALVIFCLVVIGGYLLR